MSESVAPPPRVGVAAGLALLAVALNVFSAALDLTVMTAVLPQLIVDFRVPLPAGLADAAWIVNGYLIAYIVTMPIMGKVSDLYGRRPVLLAALVLFTIGSIGAALATGIWSMVAARVVQALGGGAMVPVALAAVSDAVPPHRRPLAIGLIAAIDTAGWVAGSVYGAWVTQTLGWRWAFWLDVPLALLGIVLVAWALPSGERSPRRLDRAGALLLTGFLLAFTFALYQNAPAGPEGGALIAADGATSRGPLFPLLMALSAGLLAALVWWERRVAEPLLPLRLLGGRLFAMPNLVSLLTGVILMAVLVEIPVLLQANSPSIEVAVSSSAALIARFAGAMMAGALIAGPLVRRLQPRWLTTLGMIPVIVGLAQLPGWLPAAGPEALAVPLMLAGLGLGLVTTPIASAVLDAAPEADRGLAASLLLVARLIGMALGLAVLVTWSLRRFDTLRALAPAPPGGLADPNAFAFITTQIAEITTRVVGDLFTVTAVIALLTLIPALLMGSRGSARDEGGAETGPLAGSSAGGHGV